MSERIHVVAAVVQDAGGRILVARRPEHVHLGGLWEFPGGKLEPGEERLAGLRRELREELGIDIASARPLIAVPHRYPDQDVLLDVWKLRAWRGEVHGREGQRLRWVTPAELAELALPAADGPVLTALSLPSLYLVTPEPDAAGFVDTLETCLAAGVRLVQLRARVTSRDRLEPIVAQCLAACARHGARLLLNADPAVALALGAHGVHLSGAALRLARKRDWPGGLLTGASCHDDDELRRAEDCGVDFVVVGPVLPTRTHPDAKPLGWDRFAGLVAATRLPAFALGGLGPADRPTAWAAGSQGIAAISAIWYAPDPAAVVVMGRED